MHITLKTIAAELKMAPSTVSRVLLNDARTEEFRPETRQRILETARNMGYKRNLSAITVRKGFDPSTIGILMDEKEESMFPVIFRVIKELNRLGYSARVYCDNDIENNFNALLSNQIQYILNFRRSETDQKFLVRNVLENGQLMVNTQSRDRHPAFPVFGTDNQLVMRQMVDYLAALGHRRIALYCGPLDDPLSINIVRYQGWLEGLRKNHLENCAEMYKASSFCEEKLVRDLLILHQPTAICCVDVYFLYVIERYLLRIGFRIPQDISLISFGDEPEFVKHSMEIPCSAMSERSQDQMIEDMLKYFRSGDRDGETYTCLCGGTLVERGTTAKPGPNYSEKIKKLMKRGKER